MLEYYCLDDLIGMIDEPNRSSCRSLLSDNLDLFERAYGSSHNHQAWPGGYLDHITEVMNIALLFHKVLRETGRPIPRLSDVLLVLYLHDLEKPWRYESGVDGKIVKNPLLADKRLDVPPFVEGKIREYGFVLTEGHWNGIKYAEGEHKDYSPGKRGQLPLAAFVHDCDNWSARGWFDYPKEGDPWSGKGF